MTNSSRTKPHRRPNIWVVRYRDRFSVREEGARRPMLPPVPQRMAITIGRAIARAYGSEIFIQGIDGRIRARDSHGADPITRRG